jgi:5'(3')-deoxyribonucleotidase
MTRKVLYVDMDNVLVDFPSAFSRIDTNLLTEYEDRLDEVPGIFGLMDPIPGAVDAYCELAAIFDTYILSTSPWNNPTAPADKFAWVKEHLGNVARKRLILSHHKNLNRGHFLVDDRPNNGADRFAGELIVFGSKEFPDWSVVLPYLKDHA